MAVALLLVAGACLAHAADPLPSWKDSPARQQIVDFITAAANEGSEGHIPPAERIAVFDNDGTLWSEQPAYFQLLYAADQVRKMAADHPEWKDKEPFASLLDGDIEGVKAAGKQGLMKIIAASHAEMTSEEFAAAVRKWLDTARHPQTGRRYDKMVYQPMLELLDFLRANDFKTFIVSGGGIDFLRVFAEESYGIPPEQVVGSSLMAKYEVRNGRPAIVKLSEIAFIDDKAGKPVGIHQFIGRRPVFAAGNSDGDFEMLEWTTAGDGPRFALLIHHDDAKREWAYDRDSHIGRLTRGLDEADQRGWTVVSMKDDWSTVHPAGSNDEQSTAESN